MTVEELEGKLTSIYHEFAETISENETDEQIVARSKEWFVKRLSEETWESCLLVQKVLERLSQLKN